MVYFFQEHDIISDVQFSYQSKLGTENAALALSEYFYDGIQNDKYTACIFADLSLAFDCVIHEVLLLKLNRYGVRGVANDLLRSFLSDRSQYVYYNGAVSSCRKVKYGVPQGSCLGPFLFLTYINDLPKYVIDVCKMILYADDSVLIKQDKDINILICYLQLAISKLLNWCKLNGLKLNITKTKLMIISCNMIKNVSNISINGINLENVSSFKYLGITFDSKMSMNEHINHLKSRLSALCGITYRISMYLNTDSSYKFYYSMVYSAITYGITVWGGSLHKITYFESLDKLHKKCIGNIFKISNNSECIYKKLSILKLIDVYNYFIGLAIFKSISNGTLPFFHEFLINNEINHNHNTRLDHNYYLPEIRVNTCKTRFLYNAVKLYNDLTPSFFIEKTEPEFKKSLKRYFIDKY